LSEIAPEGVRRARELPEDPTNVEGPITDIEYRSPNQGDAKHQKLIVQDDHSTLDGHGRKNLGKGRRPTMLSKSLLP